ncbi:MAG: DNA-binding beta-propeller fold protein YncE [Myxococcota bacterium]|jgi:DNA-binding beta-propeller fold protein YncE
MILTLLLACGEPAEDCPQTSGTICTYAGTRIAGLGDEDVPADESHLYLPQDLTFGPDHRAYLLDWNNHRVRVINDDGTISTVAGSGLLGDGPEGPALNAAFNHPTNIAFDPHGAMVIAAWHNSRVETVDLTTGELTFTCGDGERSYNGDEMPAEEAVLDLPSAVVFDSKGRLFISDQANQLIRMIDTDGYIYDVAGQQREEGYSGDGGLASEAHLHASVGQAADPANRIAIADDIIYVADTGNHVIRAINLDTWIIDTIAGTRTCDDDGVCEGIAGFGGDGGDALSAGLNAPTDIAVGRDGELYIADTSNSCVRVVYPDGTIDTAAGVCGEPGDAGDGGPATEALLYRPYGVAVDRDNNLYIADTYNHVIRVVYQ